MSEEEKESWTHIQLERRAPHTIIHDQEYIGDVLFVTTSCFDENGALLWRRIVRADLVRAD